MKSKITIFSVFSLLTLNAITAQVQDVQLYGFIHSLVVHEPPLIPVPNHETTTIYWMNDIVQKTNDKFAFTGQFGQLSSHVDQLPPNDNIGFAGVDSPWDSSTGQTFATSDINTILITAANFIQWDLPTNPDPSDPMARSIVENTGTLFDWTDSQIPEMRYYIYGNWPEMDNAAAFPPTIPTQAEINEFHDITMGNIGTFDNWWIQYQDAIIESKPEISTRLIPVGRIISQIYTQIIQDQIPFDELYEDSAPHGRANTYFLAGLITYMALYEKPIAMDYTPSNIIHPVIRENLSSINNLIWQELTEFNFPNGESRVFYSTILGEHTLGKTEIVDLSPNPVENLFNIKSYSNEPLKLTILNAKGEIVQQFENILNGNTIDISSFTRGVYFVRIRTETNAYTIKKLIKI